MPRSLCCACVTDTMAAVTFQKLCHEANKQWAKASVILELEDTAFEEDTSCIYFYDKDKTVIFDQTQKVTGICDVLERINGGFRKPKRQKRYSFPAIPCSCRDCGKRFPGRQYLDQHLVNTPNRVCELCGDILAKKDFSSHLQEYHNTFCCECKTCHMLFDNDSLLFRHYSECHGPASLFCNICLNSFKKPRSLRAHMYCHALFHCIGCRKSFENHKCFKHHEKQCPAKRRRPTNPEDNQEKYTCDYCGAEYDKKPSLRIHIQHKHMHILPFVCQVCGKRTSTLPHMRSHMKTHTSKADRALFECTDCGATMRTDVGYQMHLRIHTGVRPYECPHCEERFISASRRSDHMKRRHKSSTSMPHRCDKCSARFVRPWELRKHYMSVHSQIVQVFPAPPQMDPTTKRFRNHPVQLC